MEWAFHPQYCYFMTFTYSDESLPDGNTLKKQAFRQWLNNAQKDPHIGLFRYYAVGEYGDRNGRAHYHLALFPQHPAQAVALESRWRKRYGLTHKAEINHARAAYLAQYTTKKLTGTTSRKENQEPEFRISSRNPPLGSTFVEKTANHYLSTPAGRHILEARGDVERTFRLDNRIYPIGDWALKKIRQKCGIPELHRDRLNHQGYQEHHLMADNEAEQNPEKAAHAETHFINVRKQRHYRGSPKL